MDAILPLAREEGIVAQEFSGELLVYDLNRDKVHCLNPAAALVWRSCNGKRTIRELAAVLHEELKLPADEHIVELALDRLSRARLLAAEWSPEQEVAHLTRRQLVKRLGLGLAALPLVSTIVAPKAEAAKSCLASGQPCQPGKPCCSGLPCGANNRCP